MQPDYDVLIIGSGFGGSVSALRLTEKGYRVGVLEAGRRFADDANREFAKQLWNLWAQYTLWTIAYSPKGHGVLAATYPDGTGTFEGLATGHPVEALWCNGGQC